jgi:hypothetical protein
MPALQRSALSSAFLDDRQDLFVSVSSVLPSMSDGVGTTDNAMIPAALRGYVPIALDVGLMEGFPAQVIMIGAQRSRCRCRAGDSSPPARSREECGQASRRTSP